MVGGIAESQNGSSLGTSGYALDEDCMVKSIGERIGFSFIPKQDNMAPHGSS